MLTYSEKIVKDILHFLYQKKKILWYQKLNPEIRGKYRTAAPVDFLFIDLNKKVFFLEVKEHAGVNINTKTFAHHQLDILEKIPNCFLILRFFTDKYNKNNIHYFDDWYVVNTQIFKILEDQNKEILNLNFLSIQKSRPEIKKIDKQDFKKDAGLTEKKNLTLGIHNFLSYF